MTDTCKCGHAKEDHRTLNKQRWCAGSPGDNGQGGLTCSCATFEPADSSQPGNALKPCPFCGSSDVRFHDPGEDTFWVGCDVCEVGTKYHSDKASAAKTWNTHTGYEPPAPDASKPLTVFVFGEGGSAEIISLPVPEPDAGKTDIDAAKAFVEAKDDYSDGFIEEAAPLMAEYAAHVLASQTKAIRAEAVKEAFEKVNAVIDQVMGYWPDEVAEADEDGNSYPRLHNQDVAKMKKAMEQVAKEMEGDKVSLDTTPITT